MQQFERKNISFMSIRYSVQRDVWMHLWFWLKTITFLSISISFFFPLFRSFLHGDFLLLYSILKLIRALHLLTIWTFTWVPVPSNIYLIFLWVALANVTLFTCLLHINAAGKVASLYLMRQLWFLPGHLTLSSFFLPCEAHPTTHVCLGWFFTMDRAHIGPVFGMSEETFLLRHLLNKLGSTGLGWKSFGAPFSPWSWLDSVRGPRPIVWLGNFTSTTTYV